MNNLFFITSIFLITCTACVDIPRKLTHLFRAKLTHQN